MLSLSFLLSLLLNCPHFHCQWDFCCCYFGCHCHFSCYCHYHYPYSYKNSHLGDYCNIIRFRRIKITPSLFSSLNAWKQRCFERAHFPIAISIAVESENILSSLIKAPIPFCDRVEIGVTDFNHLEMMSVEMYGVNSGGQTFPISVWRKVEEEINS